MAGQDSTLYAGSVSKAAIYEITQGEGFTWGDFVKTEILVDRKPRQLTKAKHNGNPITENVKNPRQAEFTADSAGYSIDGRQLSVAELMVPEEIDVLEWKDTFPDFQPSGLNIDLKANPKIAKTVMDLVMEATKTQMNTLHSAGDTGAGAANPLRFYDGFETLILADADATQVGTPAVLTSANIIAYMFDLRDAIPPRLRRNKGLKIFCSYADADLFDRAARATNDAQVVVTADGVRSITQASGSSIPVIPVEGISKDFVFATIADKTDNSNLVQGVWVDRDSDTLKMYRSEEADQIWKILLRMDLGVQHKTGDNIFYLNAV
jgi:hypothetical protein